MKKQKVRIAFYKASYGGVDDKFIDTFSGKDGYSHCEIFIDNNKMIGSHMQTGGVSVFNYRDVINSPRWDVIELPINHDKEKLDNFIAKWLGKKYDWLGVTLYFVKLRTLDSKEKVWCSELCALYLKEYSIDIETLIMPNALYRTLHRMFNETGWTKVQPEIASGDEILTKEEIAEYKVDRYGRIIDNEKPSIFSRLWKSIDKALGGKQDGNK